ncbi:PqqD family protein [Thioclava sp. F28-4]|uniref:PqqD family protein n=1 Tax=Thioclava sp. F28-4 TaxID=1915315 RepID=UPI000997BEC7|nr:PqqD family protein [Thioclava sp. F28-4]OOY05782.1 hypothetical protein BMI87_07145 [Thioclava sp. F28-4]
MNAMSQYRVRSECVACPYGDGVAILDLNSNAYFSLDSIGAIVWNLLGDEKSVEEIIDTISGAYSVPRDTVAEDVSVLLTDLHENGLVEAS